MFFGEPPSFQSKHSHVLSGAKVLDAFVERFLVQLVTSIEHRSHVGFDPFPYLLIYSCLKKNRSILLLVRSQPLECNGNTNWPLLKWNGLIMSTGRWAKAKDPAFCRGITSFINRHWSVDQCIHMYCLWVQYTQVMYFLYYSIYSIYMYNIHAMPVYIPAYYHSKESDAHSNPPVQSSRLTMLIESKGESNLRKPTT